MTTTPSRDELLVEFTEAGQYHRTLMALMFGELTVFLAATGGLGLHLASADGPGAAQTRGLAALGALLSFMFLIHHERLYATSYAARERAEAIQSTLGLDLYAPRKSHFPIQLGSAAVTRWFYVAATVLWGLVVALGPSAVR